MRLAWVALAVAGCKKDPLPEPPKPAPKPVTGTIRGTVIEHTRGGGAVRAPNDPAPSSDNGIECTARATAGSAEFEAKTWVPSGKYELTVPVGHYVVTFACGNHCCYPPTPEKTDVDVTVGSAVIVSSECTCSPP